MKCTICKKEAEYVANGYSQCEECLTDEHNSSCYDLSVFPFKLIDELCKKQGHYHGK